MPSGLSAVPTLYQTQCETTGARWFSMTTTCMPLSSMKVSGWNIPLPAAASALTFKPIAMAPAVAATIMLLNTKSQGYGWRSRNAVASDLY